MGKSGSRGRRSEKKEAKEAREIAPVSTWSEENQENPEPEAEEDESIPKTPFFGLVDASELDYFKQTESTLNINAFDSEEERDGFIRSVLEEAKGKELKLVTNQICSKLMERLVLFSSDRQLKSIFQSFLTHFNSLSYHKYASHVLETLLVRSARLVEKELVGEQGIEEEEQNEDEPEVQITMEELFIKMVKEIKPTIPTMLSHQYASHVLRVIILILSGKELPSTTTAHSTLRSKRSKIARKMIEIKDNEDFNRAYQIPGSFKDELRHICQTVSDNKDTRAMRTLAIDKIASPVIQLLVQAEGLVDKERGIWHMIFLKDEKDDKEGAFVEHLLSDPVGSHFLESCIKNQGVRGKYIERLYTLYMKDRVLKLSRRSTTGVYIIQALLLKLKPREVEHILDELVPELANLISVSENQNLDLGQRVIDASISRGNYRRDEIIEQLFKKFAPNYDFKHPYNGENVTTEFLENVLQLTGSTLGNKRDDWPTAEERRRSLFLEKLMEYDSRFRVLTWLNLMALPSEKLTQMCFHGVFSHVVEHSMNMVPQDEETGGEAKWITILRKRFLNQFQGQIVALACNSYGSHIVDKLWDFTVLLPMYKDRIASELVSESTKVKESTYGRLVWKNWSMELFVRKKFDWKALVKQQEKAYYGEDEQAAGGRVKKPIELKMERLMEEKRLKEEKAKEAEQGYLKRKLEEDLGEKRKRGRR